ncbi:phosphoribosyltransferase family protein [Candidatus Rhabdochlamydia sp. T3358]|uniref:phosphoribosyltransferase n=1 Tax=Candidatus Rhabdochlamydia sp. T3358 TaxID=2099795 RepID=UPI0010B8925B|nr:phosphoribosyltransferase family protein [Candidatus Rhabdochlamydia sp. T3358]VHO03608.1 Hypoxanthine phosphoribosyltransferase [Candidatus Rhabdochlamydia sp. T3358]
MSIYSTLELDLLISMDEIQDKIAKIALQLEADYKDQEIVIVMIMKGAICLVADLIRAISLPCVVESIQASSYGARGKIRGNLQIKGIEALDLFSKNVLLVDDIFDSGNTLFQVHQALAEKKPKSLKSLVLLSKNVSDLEYQPDYLLFSIENRFVVGYGLDYKEYYRGLKGIYLFKETTSSLQ